MRLSNEEWNTLIQQIKSNDESVGNQLTLNSLFYLFIYLFLKKINKKIIFFLFLSKINMLLEKI